MFLKCSQRRKDGKIHRSWSVVESRRHAGGKITQQHVLYLGEINDSQQRAWEKTIAVCDETQGETRQLALFPSDRVPPGRRRRGGVTWPAAEVAQLNPVMARNQVEMITPARL